MGQTKKTQTGKTKTTRSTPPAARRNATRRPVTPKARPKKRVTPGPSQRTRAPLKASAFDSVSKRVQRLEKQVALLQAEVAATPKSKPNEADTRAKNLERRFEARLTRLDERVDSLRAHLLDLEERLEGETNGSVLHERDLDEGLDDS